MNDNEFRIKIPEEYYKYNLVDVQYVNKRILYIFLNDKNETIYYEYDQPIDYYYFEKFGSKDLYHDINNCQIKLGKYDKLIKDKKGKHYLSDIPLAIRHTIDYYDYVHKHDLDKYQQLQPKVCYCDIEVFTRHSKEFPFPEEGKFPINAITLSNNFNEEVMTLVYVDEQYLKFNGKQVYDYFDQNNIKFEFENMTEELILNKNLFIFNNEVDMMKTFIKYIHYLNPNIITGWNFTNFDWQYIYNRMKNLGMNTNDLSRFGYTSIEPVVGGYGDPICMGYIITDMLDLYKNYVQNKKEKYTLSFIASYELKDDKIKHTGGLDDLYETNIVDFIKYNRQDVHLVKRLDAKVKHILLQDELRKTTSSTWKYKDTLRLVDSILVAYLQNRKNVACSDSYHRKPRREHLMGAYVSNPVSPGLNKWVVDYDAESLYPSLINTFNVGPNTYAYKIDEESAKKIICNVPINDDEEIMINKDPIHSFDYEKVKYKEVKNTLNNYIISMNGCVCKKHTEEKTFYYDILNELKSLRKKYKKLMHVHLEKKEVYLFDLYNNKQMAVKVVMNSIYGVLGSEYFRFGLQDLLEAVTLNGQRVIKSTNLYVDNIIKQTLGQTFESNTDKLLYEQFNNEDVEVEHVIYTDTDSCMVKLEPFLISKHGLDYESKLTDEQIVDELTPFIDGLQTIINNGLMKKICDQSGLLKEDRYLRFKNEWIAKRVWFLNVKKKYGMHKIFLEGSKVDEIECKGLETERSDYPNYTRAKLNELLHIILKSNFTYSSIMEFVDKVRKDIRQRIISGDPKIGKPVSFSKEIHRYKKIPSHVYGMILWNNIEGEFFHARDKGYLYNIHGIDSMKYQQQKQKPLMNYNNLPEKERNKIVIPVDFEKVPDYYIIDIDKNLEFAWNKRIEILLEPILMKKKGKSNKVKSDQSTGIRPLLF